MNRSLRRAYSRLETDEELLRRVRAAHGASRTPGPSETCDEFAWRCGMQRKIIWEDG